MQVNYPDFENSFHKYIDYAKHSEVIVCQDGRPIIKLSPYVRAKRPKAKVSELIGVFSKCGDVDLDEARKERLKKYEIAD